MCVYMSGSGPPGKCPVGEMTSGDVFSRHFCKVGLLFIIGYQALRKCVLSKLDGGGVMCGHTVMCVQGGLQEAQDTSLGGLVSMVRRCLVSAHQEVGDPVAEGEAEFQVFRPCDEFTGDDCVKQ